MEPEFIYLIDLDLSIRIFKVIEHIRTPRISFYNCAGLNCENTCIPEVFVHVYYHNKKLPCILFTEDEFLNKLKELEGKVV